MRLCRDWNWEKEMHLLFKHGEGRLCRVGIFDSWERRTPYFSRVKEQPY